MQLQMKTPQQKSTQKREVALLALSEDSSLHRCCPSQHGVFPVENHAYQLQCTSSIPKLLWVSLATNKTSQVATILCNETHIQPCRFVRVHLQLIARGALRLSVAVHVRCYWSPSSTDLRRCH